MPERVREEGKAWVKRSHTSPSDLWRTVDKGREELDQIDKSTELEKAIVEFLKNISAYAIWSSAPPYADTFWQSHVLQMGRPALLQKRSCLTVAVSTHPGC